LLESLGPDQRVRADLDPLGTTTGRYSCGNPPLQSLDARIREAVVAPPGCLLLVADYSQIELRVLAHLSQDQDLLDAFHRGDDLHRRAAANVLGVAEDEVTADQRQLGKKLNFGMTYGQTPFGLAREFNMPRADAESLLAAHQAAYPSAAAWTAAVHEQAAAAGEVRTLYGRRRYLSDINASVPAMVHKSQRQAVNTIIQGTAADLIKLALIRLHNVLPPEVRIVLSVHDAVVLEVPNDLVEVTRRQTTAAMETALPGFTVPIVVDVGTGKTWAACKEAD
jgi:DNA polymerase-1